MTKYKNDGCEHCEYLGSNETHDFYRHTDVTESGKPLGTTLIARYGNKEWEEEVDTFRDRTYGPQHPITIARQLAGE